ncbi:MAG: DNA repair protein RadA [Balneolaceae bacterium]
MAKPKVYYECSACGHQSAKWLGMCPVCSEWHTFEELKEAPKESVKHKVDVSVGEGQERPVALHEISYSESDRVPTGIGELDRVLGGGLMPSSLILLGGDPGIGKSTLMLQLAKSNPELSLLYVAGEESAGQIRQRADRIGIETSAMKILSSTNLDLVVQSAQKEKPDLLVIDSIQTVYRSNLGSLPGSVQQIRECAAVLQQLAKRDGVTTLMIGHVTKEGDIAGPKMLEHMVDTVLQFEGDHSRMHRLLRGVKNRFGPTQEVGVFEMRQGGLVEIENPSELFLSEMDPDVSGNAITCVLEGTRPLMVEIQALVTPASYGTPQRTASGFDQRRLALLLAVLEKRAGLQLSGQDVYLNVAGGLKVTDTAADLAVVTAIASSFRNRPLKRGSFYIGEVGLGGEVRMVPFMEQRLREGGKMGFATTFLPESPETFDITVKEEKNRYIKQVIRKSLDEEG